MNTVYNVDDTAIEALYHLINEEPEMVIDMDLSKIEYLERLASDMFEELDVPPLQMFLIGKHLEEFGKALKGISQDKAVEDFDQYTEDDSGTIIFSQNELTIAERKNYSYDSKKYTRLKQKEKGIKNAIKGEKKRLKEESDPTSITYSIRVSKS